MAEGHITTHHEKIRKWAEERGGKPATVAGTTSGKQDVGILRLDFEPKDEKLEPISWDDFFEKFEEAHLAFLYQDETADGRSAASTNSSRGNNNEGQEPFRDFGLI